MPHPKAREQRSRSLIGEKMIIPIRCFTCGKPIGHLYEEYKERRRKGVKEKEILDSLGLERYCCRRMLLTHVDLLDEVLAYEV